MQDDHGALLGIDLCEHPLDVVGIGHEGYAVRDRVIVEWHELDLHRAAASLPSQVETGVDGQSVEPASNLLGSRTRAGSACSKRCSWTASRASLGPGG